MIFVGNTKSGALIHLPQRICPIQDLEMLIIMLIQRALRESGPHFSQSLLISQKVKNQLQPEHKSLLASLFGIYI